MLLPLLATLLSAPAHAQAMALEPQVRVHAGLNVVEGPSGLGVTGGMDARLTRLIALDIGVFASPVPIEAEYRWDGPSDAATPEFFQLRHGVYGTPGLRIPHPQPKTWAWDLFLRAGGGVVWSADLSASAVGESVSDNDIRPDVGGTVGADALVRFGRVGARAFGRVWLFDVQQTSPARSFVVLRPQYGVEALVQW